MGVLQSWIEKLVVVLIVTTMFYCIEHHVCHAARRLTTRLNKGFGSQVEYECLHFHMLCDGAGIMNFEILVGFRL